MRKTLTLLTLAVGMAVGAQAQAHGLHFDNDQCGFTTNYDVRVMRDGIAFDRESGEPTRVFMHDGQLRVNGKRVALSDADAKRLQQYEGSVRGLLPEVAGIVREGLDIGFSAMTAVANTFAENGEERTRLLDRLNRNHAAALRQLDQGIGSGVWKQHEVADVIEEGVQSAVSDMVGTVTANAVKAALSGDEAKVAALEARADSLDKTIDREVDARADRLGERAQALCPRLTALEQLQQQLQFRLDDGSRLQLLSREKDHDGEAVHRDVVVIR
ncbi:MAG: DUF2884 family protein [Rhodanobacter sp.]